MWDQQRLVDVLASKGFTVRKNNTGTGEIIYERAHERDARVKVVIYTGIPTHYDLQHNQASRESSIKVNVYFLAQKTYTLGKFPAVTGVGDVSDRVVDTARQAYICGSRWIDKSEDRQSSRKEIRQSGGYATVDCPRSPLDMIK